MKHNKNGFTLVEVLTALVVLTVGIVAVQQAFIRVIGASRYSEEKLLGASLVEKKTVELILSAAFYDDLTKNTAKDEKKAVEGHPSYTLAEISRPVLKNKENFYLHEVTARSAMGATEKIFLLTPIKEEEIQKT